MALTGEGKRFLAGADDILERIAALEDAVTSARGTLKGKLRINCSWGFGERVLSLAAAEFAAANPEIELTLLLSDPPLDPVQSGLDLVIHIGELPRAVFTPSASSGMTVSFARLPPCFRKPEAPSHHLRISRSSLPFQSMRTAYPETSGS